MLSVVGVVSSHVEVSATSWSHVQRSPTDCGASSCVIEKRREWGGHGPQGGGGEGGGPARKQSIND